MNDIFNSTQNSNYNWENQIKKYDYNRTHLGWGSNPVPKRITNQMVKRNDVVYNPILQKYNDRQYDKNLLRKEKSEILSSIVTNQDNQLRIEQTYNIINLRDRLKGFENHPNYPIQKDLINKRKKIIHDSKDYNIISNLPLSAHHFDKPEKRPKCNNSELNKKQKYLYDFGHQKDYNIITTEYKSFNDEKEKIDKEVSKFQTAKIFYKNNDYNPIKGIYFNKDKEQDYQEKMKEEQKNWGKENVKNIPKCAKGNSDVYNLISLKIVDPQEFNNIINEEKKKKKRYGLRTDLENYYREQNIRNKYKEEKKSDGKLSYFRYKEEDNRQYDIIDLKERPYKNNEKKMKKNKLEGWDKILDDAGKNNTFRNKTIYKSPYDCSEAGLSYDKYKINRNKTLSNLPKIEEDKLFYKKEKINKSISHSKNDRNIEQKKFLSKEKFFKEKQKDINMNDVNHEIITDNKDYTGKKNEYKSNREKNMRNFKKNFDFKNTNKKKS